MQTCTQALAQAVDPVCGTSWQDYAACKLMLNQDGETAHCSGLSLQAAHHTATESAVVTSDGSCEVLQSVSTRRSSPAPSTVQ